MIRLTGVTWSHTRGYLPMVATAQRYRELYPDVSIQWQAKSLQEFSDARVEESEVDFFVLDHPSIGSAVEQGTILPLDELLPAEFLKDQAAQSVGLSYQSYSCDGRQWALAIDAAAPVSGWRADLLERAGLTVPRTWTELLQLARRGVVVLAAVPIDALMHFYMLYGAAGQRLFQNGEEAFSEEPGVQALESLRELLSLCDPACLTQNPIAIWQLLSTSDTVAYCPFAYGYSNYSRGGFSKHVIQVGGLVEFDYGIPLRSVLGGAGLAISANCPHLEIAADYAQLVASKTCQSTLYFDSGGQPGYRGAWLDAEVNRRCNNFFLNTIQTLDQAVLRPTGPEYPEFQEKAASTVHAYLLRGGEAKAVVKTLNEFYEAACRVNRH